MFKKTRENDLYIYINKSKYKKNDRYNKGVFGWPDQI